MVTSSVTVGQLATISPAASAGSGWGAVPLFRSLQLLPDRFTAPFVEFFTDVANLDPILAQLLVFSLLLGGVYALVALGLTMIFGVMDIVNFSHGAFLAAAMYAVWFLATSLGFPIFVAIPVAVGVLFVLGVVVERLTIHPIIDEPQHNQLIVTFGLLLVIESALEITFSPNPRSLSLKLGSVETFGIFIPIGQLIALGLALGSMVLVWVLLHRTKLGRAIRGTADDREAARYAGINIRRIYELTFGIGAALAAIGGASVALYRLFDPYVGNNYLINAFVIVVLGGLGSFPGAFVGGLIVGFIEVFGSYYLPGTSYQVMVFLIFIGMLLLKPAGLFGEVES